MDPIQSPAAPENYGPRRGSAIDMVVLHTTEGSFESAVAWFKDADAQVSAHYVVSAEGLVVQCVPETEAAWHAGNGLYNRRSVGIECEGHAGDPSTWTPALVQALTELVLDVVRRNGIPADRQHVIGHNEVPDPRDPSQKGGLHHHTDPGPYAPWPEIAIALAAQAADV